MLILPILILVLASATASERTCFTSRDCRVDCPERLEKCVVPKRCTSDYDCAEYGKFFICVEMIPDYFEKFCAVKYATCDPYLGPDDCKRFFQCINETCISEVPECSDDTDCGDLEHCDNEHCELNFGNWKMILIIMAAVFVALIIIACVWRMLRQNCNLNKNNDNYVPGTVSRSWK